MIYLDNAATTRVKPDVRAAMEPFLGPEYGNPSSLHAAGRRARRAIEDARETVASVLGADPREIVFTSGATESNALALAGRDHVVTTAIEHPSVLEAAARGRVTRVAVDAQGLVDPAALAAALTPRTTLVSVMTVNNEVGSLQPIAAIRKAVPGVLLHTDAAQAVGKVPVGVRDVDLLTFSAHKIHGPQGVGGLWVRKDTPLAAQLVGGGQEFGRRAGTENVAGIVGLAAAMKLANPSRLEALRERLRRGLGAPAAGPADRRAPHILNVSFEGVDGEALILALDAAGICISSGSACASGSTKPSHVLTAMGMPADQVKSSVRFSLSELTTDADIDGALSIVPGVVERLRRISPVTR